MIVLAGVTGSGKTTIAEALAGRLGWPLFKIIARECMEMRGFTMRQLCYINTVTAYTLNMARVGVVDNSLLSVYAYTLHYAEIDESKTLKMLASLAKRLAAIEAQLHNVVVLRVPSRGALVERIRVKARSGYYSGGDDTWWRIDHWAVQETLVDIARRWGIPVVESDGIEPTVEDVLRVATRR